MNQYKIYRDENYILVVNASTLETQYGFTEEVFIDKSNINVPSYRIFNVRDFDNTISLNISQILQEDGSAYTQSDFETFYKQNTGNFNGGSSSPGVQSVTGVGVDNTDPLNPVINVPPSGVQTVSGSLVNNSDPANPIILADGTKENISNKTGTIVGNEASTTLYANIAGLIAYFQQKLTDSIFGTFINSLSAKTTPIDADSISIVDSADTNKQKKVSLTNFKAYLKTYFDTLYQVKDNQVEVATNSNVLNAWQGQTVLFTTSCTITVPSTLNNQLSFVFRTLTGVTVTWAITAPFTWNITPTTTTENTTGHFMRRGSTNTIYLDT